MSPMPMIKAHIYPCGNPSCSQHVCKNPVISIPITQSSGSQGSGFEMMVAMTTTDRKKNLLKAFETLETLGEGLSNTQKNIVASFMEIKLWS